MSRGFTASCSRSASVSAKRVSKYLVRSRKPQSQTGRTFLENHLKSLVSVDSFTVPTIRFQVLYVFLVLAHDRRRIVHFAVTAHPTAEWTALPVICSAIATASLGMTS